MKALIYTGPEQVELRDVPMPEPAEGELLVQVRAVGICGSDMHAYLGHDERRPAPLILGHEAAGVVVGGDEDGRRVTINPLVTCGTCEACTAGRGNLCPTRQIISMPPREGAFAQYVAMPRGNLVTVPDEVPLAKAALAEPIACGWHAVRVGQAALQRPLDEMRCLVIGGGAIGFGAALSLRAQGARDITLIEPSDHRREAMTDRDGIRIIGAPDEAPGIANECHLVIDGVGFAATRQLASASARPGGFIIHIGLGESTGGLDIRRMTLQEIGFIGTYTYTHEDFVATARAIFDGSLGPLDWPEQRKLSDGPAAFTALRNGEIAGPKTILIPDQEDHSE